MSEETKMNRSSFLDIRGHQQIDKYTALNTYNITINDSDDLAYVDGTSDHNSFSVIFPDNQSSHIKNAKIRVKSVGLGTNVDGVDEASGFRIETNILKNAFNAKGRYGGHFGTFKISNRILPANRTNDIPEIDTDILRSDGAGGTTVGIAGDVGSVVSQNAHTILTTQLANCETPIGIPVDKGFYNCDNPFGKEVRFYFVQTNAEIFLDLGNDAGENTLVELEVVLLPDNQANDKFSY